MHNFIIDEFSIMTLFFASAMSCEGILGDSKTNLRECKKTGRLFGPSLICYIESVNKDFLLTFCKRSLPEIPVYINLIMDDSFCTFVKLF